jgi:hypothetical protein
MADVHSYNPNDFKSPNLHSKEIRQRMDFFLILIQPFLNGFFSVEEMLDKELFLFKMKGVD